MTSKTVVGARCLLVVLLLLVVKFGCCCFCHLRKEPTACGPKVKGGLRHVLNTSMHQKGAQTGDSIPPR